MDKLGTKSNGKTVIIFQVKHQLSNVKLCDSIKRAKICKTFMFYGAIFSGKRKIPHKNGLSTADGWNEMESSVSPSLKMTKLSSWIEQDCEEKSSTTKKTSKGMSSDLTDSTLVESFAKNFADKQSFTSSDIQLLNDPFQVATVDNFLANKSTIPNLITEMESIDWTRKQMDLYEFYQTTDLANIQSPHLAQFYKLLNTNVRDWMEKLTGMKFQKISASCSMYNSADFLLTHDDLLSDRLIAFVFYLSPWDGKEQWNESMG